jgi:arsenate reductase-like glutaredoxin family protein
MGAPVAQPVAPKTVDEWLADSNTENVLINITVVSVKLANALARALNLQKATVEDIGNEINKISDLNVRVSAFKPTSTTPTDTKKLGKSVEEATEIINLLKAAGVEVNITPADAFNKGVTANDISLWTQKLNATSDTLSNKSSQETLRLQTFTNRYTQSSDQASTLIQKNAQSLGNISRNIA